jgi:hypothetical protein
MSTVALTTAAFADTAFPVAAFPSAAFSSAAFSSTPAPRLRLTRRGRRVLLALVVVPLVVLAFLAALNGGSATATGSSAPLEYVTVQAGQSLWQLAESIAPESDPRDVMSEIRTFNGLDSVQLVPGQRLAIPTQYTD